MGFQTFDNSLLSDASFLGSRRTRDTTGAFLIGQLEKLDPTLNEPLVNITWSRDIEIRDDISIAMESASWTNSSFAASGGITPNGKAWVGKAANAIASPMVDIGKTLQALTPWAMELGYTMFELASAVYLGQPIDMQKLEVIKLKHQMDSDEQVYIGDTQLGFKGLLNNASVTPVSVPNGVSGHSDWARKTPLEILADVNEVLTTTWEISTSSPVLAVCPDKLLLPPTQFSYLVSTLISSAGNTSILTFLKANSICLELNGKPLDIKPTKWNTGAGAGGTDRMVAYTNAKKYLQFPWLPLQRGGPLEYRSLWQLQSYVSRLGAMEFRYPETISYRDGI